MNGPIIITGMHRSGTTVITKVLERLGLFVGKNKDTNYEAIFFRDLNEWMLRQCGGAWDYPAAMAAQLQDEQTLQLVKDYIRFLIRTPRIISYCGLANYLRGGIPKAFRQPWGWKDPRNNFTLPIWLDLFPSAKVVHVHRHGVDVAESLRKRRDVLLERFIPKYRSYKPLYMLRLKNGGFSPGVRCGTLEGGFSLWEEYMQEAGKHALDLKDNVVEVKYESFLADPAAVSRGIADFCGLTNSNTQVTAAIKSLNRDRAYAHAKDPKLRTFAEERAIRLNTFGY